MHGDGYCATCGNRLAAPDRDEARLGNVSLVTDRGRHHSRNEDAAAAGILAGGEGAPRAIAVAVCDGVSTSVASHVAAVAASKSGVDAMLAALAANGTSEAAVLAGLSHAAKAAAGAGADVDPSTAPSCTYTAATIVATSQGAVQISVGNVGDSRAYWLPEPPTAGWQLTVDDSLARELIGAGAAVDSEEVQQGAHTLTRWLGADSEPTPWSGSSVQTMTTAGPGSLLLCTDGLWNYLPDAADIALLCSSTDSTENARSLIEHALHAGGHDNVTVAVIPIGGRHEVG
jgi:serine/threonine protein phosphatase PrpC